MTRDEYDSLDMDEKFDVILVEDIDFIKNVHHTRNAPFTKGKVYRAKKDYDNDDWIAILKADNNSDAHGWEIECWKLVKFIDDIDIYKKFGMTKEN